MNSFRGLIGNQVLGQNLLLGFYPYEFIASGGITVIGGYTLSKKVTAEVAVKITNKAVAVQTGPEVFKFYPDSNDNDANVSGLAYVTRKSYSYIASGGGILFGISPTTGRHGYTHITNGFIALVSGTSICSIRKNFKIPVSGGISLSGDGIFDRGFNYTGNVVINLNGNAKAYYSYFHLSIINITTNGIAKVYRTCRYIGNIHINVSGTSLTPIFFIPKGGASLGGNSVHGITSAKYILKRNRTKVSGSALAELKFIIKNYRYNSQINLKLSGNITLKRFYQPLKCKNNVQCIVELPEGSSYRDCFNPILLNSSKDRIYRKTPNEAILPAITVCRQKYIVPLSNKRKDKVFS